MEVRFLRAAKGVTMQDHMQNVIRSETKVCGVRQKLQKRKLRWCGHVQRVDEGNPVREALETEFTDGKQEDSPGNSVESV